VTGLLIAILFALLVIMVLLLMFFMSVTTWMLKISDQLQQIHDLMANWK
jgi:Flp pilus assembly protein TadG